MNNYSQLRYDSKPSRIKEPSEAEEFLTRVSLCLIAAIFILVTIMVIVDPHEEITEGDSQPYPAHLST